MKSTHASNNASALRITGAMIDCAAEALERLLEFSQPADAVLSSYFREHRELGGRERGFVAETCYAVLRRKRQLEKLVAPAKSARWLVLARCCASAVSASANWPSWFPQRKRIGCLNSRRAPNQKWDWPTRPTCPTGWRRSCRCACRCPSCWTWRAG